MNKYGIFRKDYASLKDYQLAYGKAYRETNRQQLNSRQKELRKNNPEKLKAYNKNLARSWRNKFARKMLEEAARDNLQVWKSLSTFR